MNIKDLSSKLLRPIGVVAAACLFIGLSVVSPTQAFAVDQAEPTPEPTAEVTPEPNPEATPEPIPAPVAPETTPPPVIPDEPTEATPPAVESQYEFFAYADSYEFATSDVEPQIFLDKGNVPDELWNKPKTGGPYYFHWVDLSEQKSFRVSNPNSGGVKINRFYFEEYRDYKIVLAESSVAGPVDQITGIIAESNVVRIHRTPWEISAWSDRADHDGTAIVVWQTNQSLKEQTGSNGKKDLYTVYVENLNTGILTKRSLSLTSGTRSGYLTIQLKSEFEVAKFRVYVAKYVDGNPSVEALENIQTVSDTIVVPPRKWGVKINSATVKSVNATNGTHSIQLSVSANRIVTDVANFEILAKVQYYIENKDTGRIVWRGIPLNSSSILINGPQSMTNFTAHVATVNQSTSIASQLVGVRASSDNDYPVSLTPSNLSSSRFQNGSNPSTADCEQQCYGDPINALNGELFENDVDLQVEGAMPLNFVRSSSSLRSDAGAFGPGTTFSYNMNIRGDKSTLISSDIVTINQENGSTVSFAAYDGESGSKSFVAPSSVRASLSVGSDGNYTFTRLKTQDRFIFDSSGKLLKVQDRLGNEVILSYTGEKLTAVSNGSSSIDIQWTGNLISEISSGPHSVAYSYDHGRLVTVDNSQIASNKSYSYYPDGSLKTITHPNGGSYETTYDSTGRVVSQTNPLGGVTSFEYQTGGYTLITLPGGEKTREKYNNLGKLIERTLAYGTAEAKAYSYSYQGTGEKILETLPGGKKITYRYDARGNLNYLANSANEIYRFSYNSENQLIKTTDPLNRISTNEYDPSGKLLKSVDYDGSVTTYEHNSKGMLTAVKDPLDQVSGLESTYSYNSSNLLAGMTDTQGNQTSYSYNAARNLVKSTDALGNETTFSYSRNNPELVTKVRYENGAEETATYDGAGRKISATARDGSTTEYSYDSMDNLLTETTAYGTTTYEYDANQKLVAVTNAKGARIEYEHNALGLVVKEKLPGNRVKLKEYTVEGLLSAEVDPKGNRTAYAYDAAGRLVRITDALGKITTMSYDKLGNLLKKTYPSGNWVSYSYDKLNRVTTINEKDLRKTTYSYDANGNRTKEALSDGTFETRSYDSEDRLIEVVGRDGKTTSYSYDELGRTIGETRPDGSEVENSYDSVSNLTSSDYGDGHIYENSYNLKGQLIEATSPGAEAIIYSYNAAGDLVSRGPPSKTVGYEYNSYGEITTVSYANGRDVSYSYDSLGNLETVSSDGETLATYGYDSNYNLTSSSYGNGVVENTQFDALNRLSGITLSKDGIQSYSRALEFNADSQISKATTNHTGSVKQSKSYQYSPLNTVSSSKDELLTKTDKFSYDLLNNLKTLGSDGYSYNGNSSEVASSITATGGIRQYGYDARGNRTQISSALGGLGSTNYSWSQSDQLESVSLPQGSTIQYGYDAEGLLSSRKAGSASAESLIWDTASGSIPMLLEDGGFEYVYGAEATPFLQIDKSTGERIYLHGDERNSVVAATDSAGATLWHRDYNEYGSSFVSTSVGATTGSAETRFGYAGEYLDPDTKLYNLRARWYDPETASFLSVDPAVNLTGEKYSYASGNPLTYTDPLGLWSMGDTATSFAATIDGFVGFPVAANLMNSINPGSVDSCSSLYVGIGTAVGIGSMLIPGVGGAKLVGLAAKAVGKYAPKVQKYMTSQLRSDRASLTPFGSSHSSKLYFGGGTYGDIHKATAGKRKANGVEIHHMPAASMGLSGPGKAGYDAGPAVLILKSDHKLTRTYKSKVKHLLVSEKGLSIEEVARRDIRDLLQTPGGKAGYYDQGIRDMLSVPSLKAISPKEFGL